MESRRCLDLLNELKCVTERINFKDPKAVEQMLEFAITGDNNSLGELKRKLEDAKEENEALKISLLDVQKKIDNTNEIIEHSKKESLLLKNKLENSTGSSLCEDDLKRLWNIKNNYEEITSTYFSYKAPKNMAVGFVGIVAEEAEENKLVPFAFDRNEPNLTDKIYDKLREACDYKAKDEGEEECEKMDSS